MQGDGGIEDGRSIDNPGPARGIGLLYDCDKSEEISEICLICQENKTLLFFTDNDGGETTTRTRTNKRATSYSALVL